MNTIMKLREKYNLHMKVERYVSEDGIPDSDKKSRSSVEMGNKSFRPEIVKDDLDLSQYDTILVGFPIWWYVAPTIINTFLESYDFAGKKIVLFATSGGSGFGNTVKELKPSAPEAEIVEGKLLNRATDKDIDALIKML